MPKISVIFPVYNNDKYLRQAIESILDQTEEDFELIIIDNASKDKSPEIIDEYKQKDRRIRTVFRDENKGLIASLNEGISLSRGEYIARMDADDVAKSNRFEKQLKYIEDNNLVVCGTWADAINSRGEKIKDLEYTPSTEKIKFFTLFHNPFIHPSVMFKKDILKEVGNYNKFFTNIEDYELWTRIVFKYKTGNIPEHLMYYRFHDEQMTRRNNFEMRMAGILVRILAIFRFIFRF